MMNTKVVTALSDQLREGIDVHRCAAASALGRIAEPDSIDALCVALLDEDPDVRTDAAAALGQFADPQTADKLLQNLIGDPCCEVKVSAMEALVAMRHAPVIAWLRRLVAGRDENIAWDNDEFYAGAWDDWLDVQLAAIRGLGQLGAAQGVPEICGAFHDEMGQDVSEYAIDALRLLGEPGAAALTQVFQDGDERLRRRIASAVSETSQLELQALQELCLNDDSVAVRRAAVLGLARTNPGDERLVNRFSDNDAEIRQKVVELCGQAFPEQTRLRIEDKVPAVKCAAFRTVTAHPELFDEEGFSDLIQSNVAGHPLVAGEAAKAWTALVGPRALAALGTSFVDTDQQVSFRRLLIQALERLGGEAVEVLATAAGDEDRQIRIDTLTALAGIAAGESSWPGPAGQVLLAALDGELIAPPAEEPEPDTEQPEDVSEEEPTEPADEVDGEAGKVSTLEVILSGGDDADNQPSPGAGPEIELTEDDLRRMALAKRRAISKKKVSLDVEVAPYQDVRRFAARLLGDLASDGVAEQLIAALNEADVDLRQIALESLSQIGEVAGELPGQAITPLLHILDDTVHELHMPAVRALAFVSSPVAGAKLRELLGDDDIHVRLEAVRSLDRRGEVDQDVAALLRDNYPGIRLATAAAVARAHGTNAVDALIDFAFADDGMYRREAAQLLRDVSPDQATRRFLDVLADESRRREWLVAIDALGELAAPSGAPFGAPETQVAA